MSSARLEGHAPRPGQILGVLDVHAKRALTNAKDTLLPIVKTEAPGGLGAQMQGSIRKTRTGYRATVAPKTRAKYPGQDVTVVQVAGWVSTGTGIHRKGGGPKRPITSRRGVLGTMTLPGGRRVRFVKGQKPNPFIARAEDRALPVVRRVLADGLRGAARDLRRL